MTGAAAVRDALAGAWRVAATALAGRATVAALLAAVCAMLAGAVWIEIAGAVDDPAAPAAAPAAAPPLALPPARATFALPPFTAFAEVAERPLFSATRQPPPAEAGQELLGKSSSFVLLGIILSEEGKAALLRHGQQAELARLKEGQVVEGWTVQTILPDRIVLQHGATEVELKLKDHPAAPATPHLQRQPIPRG